MLSLESVRRLSAEYNIPAEDIVMIALNRYGLVADLPDKRIRFKIRLSTGSNVYYCAVCLNTYPSPFSLTNNGDLLLSGEKVADVFDVEQDTCDSTYFRRNKTALTLNSNMRSQCKGCKFCGSYNLDPADMTDLNNETKLSKYIEMVLKENNMSSFNDLVRITICTGCFEDENKLVEHILMVKRVFGKYGFNKRIRYIGSQLRSDHAMRTICDEVGAFSLTFTAECFSRRNDIMRKEKGDLKVADIVAYLEKAQKYDFSTNYLYILGLDSLDVMKTGMESLKDCINRFPGVQILQNFTPEQEEQRIPEAKNIEYYLQARKIVEQIHGKEKYRPRSWENYRGLFYTTYNSETMTGIRI